MNQVSLVYQRSERLAELLQLLEHLLRERHLGHRIPGGVGRGLADVQDLHHALDEEHREALGSRVVAELLRRRADRQAHALRSFSARVRDELDDRVRGNLLLLSPRRHHSSVVDAQHDNFRDPSLLQFSLMLLVARNREVGSAWSEGTRLAKNDDLLTLANGLEVHPLRAESSLEAEVVDGQSRRNSCTDADLRCLTSAAHGIPHER